MSTSLATDIHVPGDYSTIQQAIDNSLYGDTVLVAPGTYYENINFNGRRITVKSTDGYSVTIIDGCKSGSVITFDSGEDRQAVISGFTIQNGTGTVDVTQLTGGGIYCVESSPTILNCRIINNSAGNGGGIGCLGPNNNTLIENCYISNNNTESRGGGIYCKSSNPEIIKCTFENNTSGVFGGGIGSVNVGYGCNPIIRESNFFNNHGRDRGGAIECSASTIANINKCTFIGNSSLNGGAIYFYDGIVMNNLILNNIADTSPPNIDHYGYGGGILCAGIDPYIDNNIIAFNQAMSQGGGIIYLADAGIISNNFIYNNHAGGSTLGWEDIFGGGIAFYRDTNLLKTIIENCLIYDNFSEELGGGIYFGEIISVGTKSKIINCTVTNNDSALGSGIYCESLAELEVYNSIVYNNLHGQIYYAGLKPTVKYSCIKGDYPGNGNIDSDPIFVDPSNSDYHLTYLSPCLDAGDDTVANLPLLDYEGDPRIALGAVDMGADEFHPHLYYIGDALPSNNIQIKIVGLPSTTQVGLFLGPGALASPIPSCFGDWFLDFPVSLIRYSGYIPPDGILEFTAKIPAYPHDAYYLQALIGDDLSNLCTVEVE